MNFCLNPACSHPQNPDGLTHCISCGSQLLLKQRYRAIQPLGQGGFGRTYLAVDEDRLLTRCVIKQLLPQIEGSGSRAQASLDKAMQLFNQEAMRLCELGEHPQIPALLAFFEQNQRLYLVQEYIDGQTLWHDMQEKGAFSEQQIRQILNSLLPVLKFIHAHNVIHRDITPVNILRRQRDGQLMLIDFGVAKVLSKASLMQTGTKIGTQGYAPLEQLRSGKAYPASDIYSLGVTCINLLTCVKPDHLFDPLRGWVWREHLAKRGAAISEQLAQILDKMIEDMVSARYQSAEEVLKNLNEIKAAPPPPPPPAQIPPLARVVTPPPTPTSKPKTRGWKCAHTLTGHSSWVTSVAISSNGLILVSGSLDDTVKVWNLNTGELLHTLFGHLNAVNCVAISPDGQIVASCSDDGTVKLWHTGTGSLQADLAGHLRDINAVAISPDGQIVASGSEDRTVKLWQIATAKSDTPSYPTRTLGGRSGMVKSVAFSPNGQLLASGGLDNNIYLWNAATGELVSTLSGHFNSVNSVAISPDGKLLASGSKDRTVKLWQITPDPQGRPVGSLLHRLSSHLDMVNSVAFSAQGSMLASGSRDQTVKLWNTATGKLLGTFSGHVGAVNAVAVSADGKTIVSGSSDKTIKIYRWVP